MRSEAGQRDQTCRAHGGKGRVAMGWRLSAIVPRAALVALTMLAALVIGEPPRTARAAGGAHRASRASSAPAARGPSPLLFVLVAIVALLLAAGGMVGFVMPRGGRARGGLRHRDARAKALPLPR